MAGWIVEWTITSAPLASLSTCSDADDDRGGRGTSLVASPPITTLPAGVSTRYEAWPGIWVERIALTLTSPSVQTVCGSFLGVKVMTFANSAGPPGRRTEPPPSARRWAISPDCRKTSPICATNFWQLMVKPNFDSASALQTMSSFGPFESQIQRC